MKALQTFFHSDYESLRLVNQLFSYWMSLLPALFRRLAGGS
jgi:hypothetical protein